MKSAASIDVQAMSTAERSSAAIAGRDDEPATARRTGFPAQRFLLPVLGVAIVAIAVYVLRQLIHGISLSGVFDAVGQIPTLHLAYAIGFTALSFAAIALYDVVAVETVARGRIPWRVSAMAGAAGYAVSNALGFSLLTGGALRYRIYAAEGIPVQDIGRIIGTSWLSIWMAFAVLVGIALLADPQDLPWLSQPGPGIDIALGAAIVGGMALFIFWLSGGERTLTIGKVSARLPSSRGAMIQIAAGIVDISAAAATLYVLMPDTVTNGPIVFALIFVLATVVGIASHSPGGLGAFEATIIAALGISRNTEALAALLAYRAIYTLLPFLVATLGLIVSEIIRHREHVGKGVRTTARLLEPLVPPVSAGITFLGGIILLFSTATPAVSDRLEFLADFIPLPFIELSHLGASFVAVAMLIVARGLGRRLRRAWVAALILFGCGAVLSIFKGFDWEEAMLLCLLSVALVVFRNSFYRGSDSRIVDLSWGWLASVGTTALVALWIGLFVYRHVEYSNVLWWQFELQADAPRFLRAAVMVALVIAAVAFDTAIHNRADRKHVAETIPPAVPGLVAHAHDTSAALALLGDKQFLMAPGDRGFLMYARSGGSLIAMGEPVGDPDTRVELAWSFREMADRLAARTVFYEVGSDSLPLFLDMGLIALKLGEVARVDLAQFSLEGPRRQPLRYAARRAEKDGLVFEIVDKARVPAMLQELRAVSDAWLEGKGGKEKGFSLGFFDEDYVRHFDCAVMRKGDEIVAFANVWRSGDLEEFSVDLMRSRPGAPAATMEALFARLLLAARDEGFRWFNLGAAPLSGLSDSRLASRWNRFGSFLYRRGADLYNFDGLRAFKNKFDPVWTPHYLICPPGLDTPRALIDVTTLINGGPLEMMRK